MKSSCSRSLLAAVLLALSACSGGASTPSTHPVGGNVAGLLGVGLTLGLGGQQLEIASSGPFSFPAELEDGTSYAVAVMAQPSRPGQICAIENGEGTAGTTVPPMVVTCTTVASVVDAFASCDSLIEPVDGRDGAWSFLATETPDNLGSAGRVNGPPCRIELTAECTGCSTNSTKSYAWAPFHSDQAAVDLTPYAGLILEGIVPSDATSYAALFSGDVGASAMAAPLCQWVLAPMATGQAFLAFSDANGGAGCDTSAVTGLGFVAVGNIPTIHTVFRIDEVTLSPALQP